MVIALVETAKGIKNVDAIAAVAGIDMVWLGHYDQTNFIHGETPGFLAGNEEVRVISVPSHVRPPQSAEARWGAPVSHQKRPCQCATNAIERVRKRSKINEADRFTAAHNGLAAGRARSESTTRSIVFRLGTLTPQMRGPSIRMPIGARTHADSQLLVSLSAKGVRFVLFVRHSYPAATPAL
jgi:hypothetical protein